MLYRMAESQPADLALMRELNEQIVLGLLRQGGAISRAELARRSNLSRSTISSIIATLLASNTVQETGIGDSHGGRRPIIVEFNYQSAFAIGVDLSSSTLTILLTDLAANVLRQVRVPFDSARGPEICIAQLAAQINLMLHQAHIPRAKVVGVGVGVPGPLAYASGRLVSPPAMPGWHDVPLRGLLEEALGLRIFIDNDANFGALAEHHWGAARGCNDVIYVYLGNDGIGCGLILDGKLYRGDTGSAGEIGHLMIAEDGPACRCGTSGCLEAIASVPAILKRAQALGLACREIGDLICLADGGNRQAIGLIEATGAHLGVALASIIDMLNPGCVIIGGVLSGAGDTLLQPIRSIMQRRGLAVAVEHVVTMPGLLGYEVVAVGAVSLVVQHAFSSPATARASNEQRQEVVQV